MRSGRLFEEDAGRCTGALISLICQSTLRPGLGNFASAAGNILLGSTSPWTSQPAVMMTGMLNAPAAMVEVEEATGIVVLDGEAMPGTCCSLAPVAAHRLPAASQLSHSHIKVGFLTGAGSCMTTGMARLASTSHAKAAGLLQ